MQLIRLSSTNRSFKTVMFNRNGLSLIVGRHSNRHARNIHSTYNGVGKSLLVALLHFCLGASKNKHLEAHLKDWCFILDFEHEGREYTVARVVGDEKIELDGKEMKLSAYKEFLNNTGAFYLPADAKGLTFRSLINFFLRSGRRAYTAPDLAQGDWKPYYRILYQCYLLGMEYHRIIQKHDAKKKLDEQSALAKKYKEDEDLRDFYLGEKNAEMELASLKERISKLREDLSKFVVAKDYSDREAAANQVRAAIVEARNREAILDVRLNDINLALAIRPDVAPDRVKRLYEEANFALPGNVVKRLDEVEVFYARLRENRERRLDQEKRATVSEHREWQQKRSDLENELDGLLRYLEAHRALDEYTENNRFLSELAARQRKIEDYLSLIDKYTNEAQKIRAEMGQATVETTAYLDAIKPHRDFLMESFRGFAREFYGDKPAGLAIKNNDRIENQIRYDVEARIEFDQADGINDVKIFCFDILLLSLRQRHKIEFLFHDSRLFSDMDWHQRLTLFKVAERVCREQGLQYIATVTEDQIDSVKEAAGEDFERLFVSTRVLELTDEPDGSGKLLGVQIEMKYEDE